MGNEISKKKLINNVQNKSRYSFSLSSHEEKLKRENSEINAVELRQARNAVELRQARD
ncbi:unnamed protein product, partial [Rotaria socialis]